MWLITLMLTPSKMKNFFFWSTACMLSPNYDASVVWVIRVVTLSLRLISLLSVCCTPPFSFNVHKCVGKTNTKYRIQIYRVHKKGHILGIFVCQGTVLYFLIAGGTRQPKMRKDAMYWKAAINADFANIFDHVYMRGNFTAPVKALSVWLANF